MIRLAILLCLLALSGCAGHLIPSEPKHSEVFQKAEKSDKVSFLDREALAAFEAEADPS